MTTTDTHRRHLAVVGPRTRAARAADGPAARARAAAAAVDARGLERALAGRVRGEVRFDGGSRALYATDGSNYRQVPIGVVVPRDADDVVAALGACREFGAPVLSRGGGTSLAGQCCNVAVVLDMSKYMHAVREVDPERRRARVDPGCVLDDLRDAAEEHGLTFGPDPATHTHCTLGGMVGNNSCGVHAQMAGRTSDNVHELEIVTYRGLRLRVGATGEDELARVIAVGDERARIYRRLRDLRDRYAALVRARYPKIPRRVSGYNLDDLLPERGFHVARALVGSESTLVTVLEITARLVPSPPYRALVALGYPDVYAAGDHVPEINEFGPIGLEGLDDRLIGFMKKKHMHPRDVELLPEGGGWLLVEFGADRRDEAERRARAMMAALESRPGAPSMKLFADRAEEKHIWEIRESGLGATARVPGERDGGPGWEDSAVPPERVGDYLRGLRELLRKYDYHCSLYGHFGQGCIHTRIDFDLTTRGGVDKYHAFLYEAADLVNRYGGSYSGEHGDGQARAELLPKLFGPELVQAFREFKAIWDPDGKMNPGKVVDPYSAVDNLRIGPSYAPPEVSAHFALAEDGGNFARATTRCVGVGKCRREGGGTMCPSYMVTREEMHSTRGRARLLFEMLEGDPIGGWKSEAVREALDLCLSCKGCKHDCPVNVDMATYKAEFLSHYYEGRLRPRSGYAFGLIDLWSRLVSPLAPLANLVTQAPGLGALAKAAAGVDRRRPMPPFAPRTFRQLWRERAPANEGMKPVLLWADTFTNYFQPEVALAAAGVLERAGFAVRVPERPLCCGRPLYDYGMLDRAERYLREVLAALKGELEAGVPVVGLEPSCVAVFRDELVGLLPHSEDARRLKGQAFTLGEFLLEHADGYEPPRLERRALVHGHCHHKSVLAFDKDLKLLEKMGLAIEQPDSGCCGMAGGFGYEKGHYDVSVAAGERVLLPAVRDADDRALVVTDGFSCRSQIEQLTDRRALHTAQVLALAYAHGREGPPGPKPERALAVAPPSAPPAGRRVALLGLGAAAVGALGLLWWRSRRRSAPRLAAAGTLPMATKQSHAPGAPARWATGAKGGVGTALGDRSRVWFTIARGRVTETYYPEVDTPQVRALGLLVGADDGLVGGVASIVIGVLLAVVAVTIMREGRGLVIGESAAPEVVERIRRAAEVDADVEGVASVLTMQIGPGEVLLNASVAFRPGLSAAALVEAVRRVEGAIRREAPSVRRVFIDLAARPGRSAPLDRDEHGVSAAEHP